MLKILLFLVVSSLTFAQTSKPGGSEYDTNKEKEESKNNPGIEADQKILDDYTQYEKLFLESISQNLIPCGILGNSDVRSIVDLKIKISLTKSVEIVEKEQVLCSKELSNCLMVPGAKTYLDKLLQDETALRRYCEVRYKLGKDETTKMIKFLKSLDKK